MTGLFCFWKLFLLFLLLHSEQEPENAGVKNCYCGEDVEVVVQEQKSSVGLKEPCLLS